MLTSPMDNVNHSITQLDRLAISDASFPSPVSAQSPLDELERAIEHQRERLRCISATDPDRLHILYEKSVILYFLYRQRYRRVDLDGSIEACCLAEQAMTAEYVGKRTIYSRLSSLFEERCTAYGAFEDQVEALKYGRLALEEVNKSSDLKSKRWWLVQNETFNSLCRLIQRFPGAGVVDWLVEEHRKILSNTLPNHPYRSRYLSRLCYLLAFRRAKGDLTEAIHVGYESIEALKFADRNENEYLTLGGALVNHYQAENLYRSLQEAAQQTVLSLEHDQPENHLATYCNLGSISELKCQRLRNTDPAAALCEIDEAIEIGKIIESAFDNTSRNFAHALNMIGAWYTTKMTLTGHIAFGDQAATFQERALALKRPGQIEYPHILHGLAHLRETQSRILIEKRQEDAAYQYLDEAIAHQMSSLDATHEDDPLLGERHLNLGKMMLRKFNKEEDEEQELIATRHFRAAFTTIHAPLQVRLPGAIQAGLDAFGYGRAIEAIEIYDEALAMLKTLNEYSISNRDLQQVLTFATGLATYAASISLGANRTPYQALMCLETGRCVIAGIAIGNRTDLSELYKTAPNIAIEYETLRKQYAQASKDLMQREMYQQARQQQRKAAEELVLKEALIRQIPGWEFFQLSQQESDVRKLAVNGVIVVVNATQIRSDALIISEKEILHVELGGMQHDRLMEFIPLFDRLGSTSRRNVKKSKKATATSARAKEALLWLWRVAVEPILAAVAPMVALRRVWWLTTGLAGRAPFHAAGNHYPGSRENTRSRVVSSYISSLKALRFSRLKRLTNPREQKMLLVTMTQNPSPHEDLDTSYEVKAINETFTEFSMHLKHPKPQDVVDLLPSFPFVHFACHGASIAYDPSQSGLLLAEDGKAAMLTISDLEKVDIKEGAVAYLSACSTAEQTDGRLADEAIHLANSFQALGFQHVIGTMWGAEDRAAGEIARRFYARLFPRAEQSQNADEVWDVATALHGAISDFIDETNADVVSWGPFIHIGC